MFKKIFVIFFVFISGTGFTAGIRVITLSNALQFALKNNLQLRQSEKDMQIAELQYRGAVSGLWIPSINLSGNFTYIDPDTVTNARTVMTLPAGTLFPGQNKINLAFPQQVYGDNYSASLSVTKPFFSGLRLLNAKNIKKLNLELYKMKYDDVKNKIIAKVSINFYNMLLIKENAKLTEDLNQSLLDRLNYVQKNLKVGLVARYDLIRTEVAYKHNQPILRKINNAYKIAEMAFCNFIGVYDDDNTIFIGNLMDSTNMSVRLSDKKAVILALSNNIRSKSIEYQIKILKLTKKVSEAARLPILLAFFNDKYAYKLLNMSAQDRSWVNSWNAGVQIKIPFDDLIPGSKISTSIEVAKETILKLELVRKQVEQGITLEVKALMMKINQAREAIETQNNTLKESRLGLKIENNRYKAGTASSLDVNDAELSFTRSQVSYLQAIYDYFSSVIQLKKLTGTL